LEFEAWVLGFQKKGEAVLTTSLVLGAPVIIRGIESNREHMRQAGRLHTHQRTFPLGSSSEHHAYYYDAGYKSQVHQHVQVIFDHRFHGFKFLYY
jgi:hypothetical protein